MGIVFLEIALPVRMMAMRIASMLGNCSMRILTERDEIKLLVPGGRKAGRDLGELTCQSALF